MILCNVDLEKNEISYLKNEITADININICYKKVID